MSGPADNGRVRGPDADTHVRGPDADARAAEVRRARFGALPERVALADLVEERPVPPPHRTADAHDPDSQAVRFSCLAADLGL
ncbi:hypothetical protein [Kitasatospora fiedleri]|uniref:hypothetical protein n=1 Tax=Kitasatospora fiedleri TaxID=2991545 RepID=UPI000CC9A282|nr:hypothetical protein [Kitasatospora fiedleri]